MTNLTLFNQDLAQQLVDASNHYPVDFESAWQWLGYSTKGNAKTGLLACGFIEGTDLLIVHKPTTTGIQAHPEQIITLTIDCFKTWGMMAGTEQGKQVRLYFLECERKLKVTPKTPLELAKEQVKLYEALELAEAENKILKTDNNRQSEIIDELFDYSSIIRIAKYNNVDEKCFSWRKLKAACKVMNLEIKEAPCPRFGTKKLWPHQAWRFAYPEYRVPETTTLIIHNNTIINNAY
jgi:phage anti-repressor protein